MIETFGGGMKGGSKFHFALTGGAAGTIVPEALIDVPISYDSAAEGVSLGAGAFLICDQSVSPVALLRQVVHFFEVESCGLCTPCRIGTRQARQILDGILAGEPPVQGAQTLSSLAEVLGRDSLCGLGQSVAWPINSAMAHFADDFRR
jgi:NADH:ubiquinone oxidoreductase subunit F (NADH-binding)